MQPDKLEEDYKIIGQALIEYEEKSSFLFPSVDARGAHRFRIAASLVATEVLQGYLDDIVALDNSDKDLFLHRNTLGIPRLIGLFSVMGLVITVGISFQIVSSGFEQHGYKAFFAGGLMLFLSIPLVFISLQSWSRQARRLKLARVVSYELARRRGDFGDGLSQPTFGEVLLRGLRAPQTAQTPRVFSKIRYH